VPFSPIVENPGTGAFLTEDPKKIIQEGRFTKMPIIIGATDLEGGGKYSDVLISMKTIALY